jgi:peptide/nickel transport system substrate-binding protein
VRSDSRLKLVAALSLGYEGLTMNIGNGEKSKNPLGQSAKVRHALNLAIDREALNQVVYNGEFVPGNQWVNPEHPYYQKGFPVPKRDVAKAKALLKEAGVTTPITLDFMVPNNPERRQTAELLQAMAGEVGFDLKIRVTEFATSLKQAEQGEFQLYIIGWSGRTDPDGNLAIFYGDKAPQNNGGFSNPEVDKLIADARAVSDPAKRKAIYEKITGILQEEGSILYLLHTKVLVAHTTKLEGYRQMPDGLVRVVGLRLK